MKNSPLIQRANALKTTRGRKAGQVPRTKLKRIPTKIVEVKEKPLLILPEELKFHPLLERVAMLPDLVERETRLGNAQGKSRGAHKAAAEEMAADHSSLIDSISRHGIREKLKVVKIKGKWLIVDGRHRFAAARSVIDRWDRVTAAHDPIRTPIAEAFAVQGLPCEEVQEADVVPIIMDAVTRRHMSKGARAYLAVLMSPAVAQATPGKRTDLTTSALNAEVLAKTAGVSQRLVEDAIALFRLFEGRADLRKKFEDAIWVGAGLAKLKAGVEGFLKTGTEPDEEPETDEQKAKRLATERVETTLQKWVGVGTAFKNWDTLTPDGQETVTAAARETVLALPESVRSAISDALSARQI